MNIHGGKTLRSLPQRRARGWEWKNLPRPYLRPST